MAKTDSIKEQITAPDGVQLSFADGILTASGEKGSLSKTFSHPRIQLTLKDKQISIGCSDRPTRKEKALVGTYVAHINNMFTGVTEGFEYHMKTVFSHFPIKTTVEDNTFVIQNFLGERAPRKALILDGVTVTTKGEDVTVSGIDKEKVGQTAANIERATRVKRRDIRVFQDGVYIIDKKR